MRSSRMASAGVGLATAAAVLTAPSTAASAAGPTASTVAAATASVSASATLAPSAVAAADLPAGLVRVATRTSLLGTHTWYRQTFAGLPVIDGYYARHAARSGKVTIADGRRQVPRSLGTSPKIGASKAEASAVAALRAAAGRLPASKRRTVLAAPSDQRVELAVRGGASARLVWRVRGSGGAGSTESVVDAATGEVLSSRSRTKNADGRGRVFAPSPSVSLKTQDLLDRNDTNQSAFIPAYRIVPLTNLDDSGTLSGDWARITNDDVATTSDGLFRYLRKDERFEQVMAYHHVTSAQSYIQSLGFTDVNNEAQDLSINTFTGDNSFYDPSTDEITFGSGGVDDAEDAEIVWHELGHAIQDAQVPGFGTSSQGGAIGEGFGDYWAVTMSVPTSAGFDVACVGDWDAVSYTTAPHCLRRTDGTKTTDDIDGEVHDDGEIWSRALFDIHRGLGRRQADKVILESQFSYAPDTSFTAAAEQVVATAQELYGYPAAKVCRNAFQARKIM
jgi:Zn-dependent metalloprotease